MGEEVKVKMSIPMFQDGELERFDNNIHNIIEEYSKMMFKEKDQILTQRIIIKQEQEINKLKKEKRKVIDYINKHCVNEKVSKEVGFKVYTMAVTDELEKIMKMLGDDENVK